MNLYEFEAKQLFSEFGIPVPPALRITTPNDLDKVQFEYPITLKCQVLSGGRGKAGGIKFAANLLDGKKIASDLLQLTINGSATQSLLIEPKLAIAQELYLAITLDRERGCPIFIASREGGIEIESSHAVITKAIAEPYSSYVARELANELELNGKVFTQIADIAHKLYELFYAKDLDLAEINPLVVTDEQKVIALDGKVIVNDDALARQSYFNGWQEKHLDGLTEREKRGKLAGINLVELSGTIGILCNGAGLTMATMDMVKHYGGQPANFLDVGGGANQDKTLAALQIVAENPEVKVILLNILGGITACDEVARALVKFIKKNPNYELIVRLQGNNHDLAKQILADSGLNLFDDLESAVHEAVKRAA